MTNNTFSIRPVFKIPSVTCLKQQQKENNQSYSLIINRLGGVMVKASASRAEDRGSIPGRVMPKTLKMEF